MRDLASIDSSQHGRTAPVFTGIALVSENRVPQMHIARIFAPSEESEFLSLTLIEWCFSSRFIAELRCAFHEQRIYITGFDGIAQIIELLNKLRQSR